MNYPSYRARRVIFGALLGLPTTLLALFLTGLANFFGGAVVVFLEPDITALRKQPEVPAGSSVNNDGKSEQENDDLSNHETVNIRVDEAQPIELCGNNILYTFRLPKSEQTDSDVIFLEAPSYQVFMQIKRDKATQINKNCIISVQKVEFFDTPQFQIRATRKM